MESPDPLLKEIARSDPTMESGIMRLLVLAHHSPGVEIRAFLGRFVVLLHANGGLERVEDVFVGCRATSIMSMSQKLRLLMERAEECDAAPELMKAVEGLPGLEREARGIIRAFFRRE